MLAPRLLFAGLVDDAALFPPGNAPMEIALREHEAHKNAAYGDLVGPFVCPVSRVDELTETLPGDATLDVSLVVDAAGEATHAALRTVSHDPRLSLLAVEAAAERLGAAAATVGANLHRLAGVTGYLEVPRTSVDQALDLVATGSWSAAKFRTGGVQPGAVPSGEELAAFIRACVHRRVSFKLTAGLHHAVARGFEGTGSAPSHGVLNVLVAVAETLAGTARVRVAELLTTATQDELCTAVRHWPEELCRSVRSAFSSFGCCGVTDPIDELVELGLVSAAPTREPAEETLR